MASASQARAASCTGHPGALGGVEAGEPRRRLGRHDDLDEAPASSSRRAPRATRRRAAPTGRTAGCRAARWRRRRTGPAAGAGRRATRRSAPGPVGWGRGESVVLRARTPSPPATSGRCSAWRARWPATGRRAPSAAPARTPARPRAPSGPACPGRRRPRRRRTGRARRARATTVDGAGDARRRTAGRPPAR